MVDQVSEGALRKHPGLGSLLKSWRRQVRLTQQEVAAAVSSRGGRAMTPNWYAKLENRDNAHPSEEDLDHILAVLGRTRWEAEQALGTASVGQLDALADARPEPQPPGPSWSDDVAAGSAFMAAGAPSPAGATPPADAPPRMRMGAVRRVAPPREPTDVPPPREPADEDLRAALLAFGLPDAAAEEALAYARSLRARSQPDR
jgi:transcriptional regulator with XRE-family HTH domain